MSVPAHVPHIGTPLAICNRKINSNFQENKQSGDYFCNFFENWLIEEDEESDCLKYLSHR